MVELLLRHLSQLVVNSRFSLRDFLEGYVEEKVRTLEKTKNPNVSEMILEERGLKVKWDLYNDVEIREYKSGITFETILYKTENGFITEFLPGIWLFHF